MSLISFHIQTAAVADADSAISLKPTKSKPYLRKGYVHFNAIIYCSHITGPMYAAMCTPRRRDAEIPRGLKGILFRGGGSTEEQNFPEGRPLELVQLTAEGCRTDLTML